MISLDKKYQTRDGKSVEIIDINTTDRRYLYPVTVRIDDTYKIRVTIDGAYRRGKTNDSDIIEVDKDD